MKLKFLIPALPLLLVFIIAPHASAKIDPKAEIITHINERIIKIEEVIQKINDREIEDEAELYSLAISTLENMNELKTDLNNTTDLKKNSSFKEKLRANTAAIHTLQITIKAEGMGARAVKMIETANTLEDKINIAKSEGENVASLETSLLSMREHLEVADALYEEAEELIPLFNSTDGDYATFKETTALAKEARAKLKAGGDHLKAALELGREINQKLKTF